jgi:hypothetical protein
MIKGVRAGRDVTIRVGDEAPVDWDHVIRDLNGITRTIVDSWTSDSLLTAQPFDVPLAYTPPKRAIAARSLQPDREPEVVRLFEDQARILSLIESGPRLVIVGSAGAGKTFALLSFARARTDDPSRAGFVLSLAGWRPDHSDIEQWILGAVEQQWGLSRTLFKRLVRERRVALFLDGLDEATGSADANLVEVFRYITAEGIWAAITLRAKKDEVKSVSLYETGILDVLALEPSVSARVLVANRVEVQVEDVPTEFLESPLLLSLFARVRTDKAMSEGAAPNDEDHLWAQYHHINLVRVGRDRRSASAHLSFISRRLLTLAEAPVFVPGRLSPAWLPDLDQWIRSTGHACRRELQIMTAMAVCCLAGAGAGWEVVPMTLGLLLTLVPYNSFHLVHGRPRRNKPWRSNVAPRATVAVGCALVFLGCLAASGWWLALTVPMLLVLASKRPQAGRFPDHHPDVVAAEHRAISEARLEALMEQYLGTDDGDDDAFDVDSDGSVARFYALAIAAMVAGVVGLVVVSCFVIWLINHDSLSVIALVLTSAILAVTTTALGVGYGHSRSALGAIDVGEPIARDNMQFGLAFALPLATMTGTVLFETAVRSGRNGLVGTLIATAAALALFVSIAASALPLTGALAGDIGGQSVAFARALTWQAVLSPVSLMATAPLALLAAFVGGRWYLLVVLAFPLTAAAYRGTWLCRRTESLLRRAGHLPRDLTSFLRDMERAGLMVPDDQGYRFIHQRLAAYYLQAETAADTTGP